MSKNQRGIKSWFELKGRNFERWLFLFHRASGVVIGLYFVLHVIETANSLDADVWTALMAMLSNPAAHSGLLIIAAFSVFHALNGVRLLLVGQGVAVGKPVIQGFPIVKVSLTSAQRRLAEVMLVLTLALTVYAFYQLFIA